MKTRLAVCVAAIVLCSAGFASGQAMSWGRTRQPGSIGNTRSPGRISGWPQPFHPTSIRQAQQDNTLRSRAFGSPRADAPPTQRRSPFAQPAPVRSHDFGRGDFGRGPGHVSGPFDHPLVGEGGLISPGTMGPPLHPGFDPGHSAVVGAGSGLTVSGAINDDDFRLRFHLGWPGVVVKHADVCPPFLSYPYQWWGWHSWYDWYDYNDYQYIDGPYGVVDPALAGYSPRPTPVPAAPEPPPTDREIGDAALANDRPEEAVAAYRAHLAAAPGDAEVVRLLGLALIDAGDVKEGVAVVGLAYHSDLTLCEKPISAGVFGRRASDLRRNVNRVSGFAQESGSSSAWLAMAVLVHAEGRTPVAGKVLDKARAAGLHKAIADRVGAAIGR